MTSKDEIYPSEIDAAWAAGFFDGEGNVGIHSQGKRNKARIQVQIAQSAMPELLDRFRDVVGTGKVRGPYGPYKTQTKPYYLYHAFGTESVVKIYGIIGKFLGTVKQTAFERIINEAL